MGYLKKGYCRYIAIILIAVFVINTSANTWIARADTEQERQVLYELLDKRTENKKFFMNNDGTETIRTYVENIHYYDGEKFEEINADLEKVETDEGSIYKTISNDLLLSMPEVISEECGIDIKTSDEKNIEMIPQVQGSEISTISSRSNNNWRIVETVKEDVNGAESAKVYSENQLENEEFNKIVYEHDENLRIMYNPTKHGVKETFILNSYQENNIYSTKVSVSGYRLELEEEYNRINVIDIATNEIEGIMPQPVVYDSSEEVKVTLDSKYTLEKLGNSDYLVSVVVGNEFLINKSTTYPVYVDPSYTRIVDKSNHHSSYVMSGYPYWNFFGNNSMPVGYYNDTQGLSRTYVTVDVPVETNEVVISANYRVFSKGIGSTIGSGNFSIYSVNTRWDPQTINWNNRPAQVEKVSSKYLSNPNGEWVTFDMTKFATLFKQGKANSFVFIADNEYGTYRNFASEYYPSPDYEPYFEVIVGKFDNPPTAVVTANSINSGTGSVDLNWKSIPGVSGYKLGIFNGGYYEWIDVGNVTSYSTLGKGLWPTPIEIENGRNTIHLDGRGGELSDDPSNVYKRYIDSSYKTDKNYYFRVKAYNSLGDECAQSSYAKIQLPDRTKPFPVCNLNAVVINSAINTPNSGQVNLKWDNSSNNDVVRYKIEKRKAALSNGTWSEYSLVNDSVSGTITTFNANNLEDAYKHQFRITAYDAQGNYSDPIVSSEVIIEDRTPPSVGTLQYNTNYISQDFIDVTFNELVDASKIKSIEFRVQGKPYESYSIDKRVIRIDLSGLPSKDHIVDYKFTDVFNNYSEGYLEIKRDIDSPQITLQPQGLKSGDYFTGVMAIDIVVNDLDSSVSSWNLYYYEINTSGKNKISSGVSNASKTIGFSTRDLVDGKTYVLKLEAIDVVGNVSFKEFTFVKKQNVQNLTKSFSINLPSVVKDSNIILGRGNNGDVLYLYNNKTKELEKHSYASKNGQNIELNSLNLEEGGTYYAYLSSISSGQVGYSKAYYKGEILRDDFKNLNKVNSVSNFDATPQGLRLVNKEVTIDPPKPPITGMVNKTSESEIDLDELILSEKQVDDKAIIIPPPSTGKTISGTINLIKKEFEYFVDAIKLDLTVYNSLQSDIKVYNASVGNGSEELVNIGGVYRLPTPTKEIDLKIVITANEGAIINKIEVNAFGAFLEEAPDGELINIKLVDEPEIIKTKANLDYKTKIIWNPSETENVKYNVYRGKTNDFVMSEYNMIASNISENGFSDYNLNYGQKFYYKVTAVKEFGGVKRESTPSLEESFATVVDKNEIDKNVGKQDYYEFVGYSTAEGTGNINISNQNLVYESTDLGITSPGLAMALRRTYNSLSSTSSAYGYNFDFSFNILLFKEYSENQEVAVLLKDGDGTIHRFEKLPNSAYKRPQGIFLDIIYDKATDTYKILRDDGITYYFDNQLRLEKFTDKNNNYLKLEYNSIGEIWTIENNIGDKIELIYNSKGYVSKAVTRSNIEYSYVYDSQNRLIEVKTYVNNNKVEKNLRRIRYSYGANSNEFRVSDAKGNETKTILNNSKEATKVIYPNQEWFQITEAGNQRIVRTDKGKEVIYLLDDKGLPIEIIDESGKCYYYEYNEDFLVTKDYTLKNGEVVATDYQYNDDGKIIKVIDATNNWSELKYNDKGDPSEAIIPLLSEGDLSKIQFRYDNNRNLTSEVDPLNRTKEYTYNSNGQITSVKDIYGNVSYLKYNNKGKLYAQEDSIGRNTYEVVKFDEYGNASEIVNYAGLKITKAYNSLGELVYFQDVDGYYETYYYDKNSNLTLVVDSRSRQTMYHYDNLDRLICIIYPDMSIEEYRYEYDSITGNEIDIIIDGDNVETKTYYDELGRVWKKSVGDITVLENKYDEVGNLIEVIDGKGIKTKAKYDILGRQTLVTLDPEGLDIKQQIEYDSFGKINNVIEPTGEITRFEYDKLGRIIKETEVIDGDARVTQYTLDEKVGSNARNTSIDPLGRKSEAYYDSVGRVVKEVVFGDKNNSKGIEKRYTYNDKFDKVDTIYFQDGTTQEFSYTDYGELKETRYISKTGEIDTSSNFIYDSYRRLEETENTSGNTTIRNSYAYDIMDNIIQKVQGNQLITYKYSAGDRLVKLSYPDEVNKDRLKNIEYDYDASGRLNHILLDGKLVNEYYYAAANELDKVKYYSKFDTGGTEFIEIDYTYNQSGLTELVTYKKNGSELKEKHEINYEKNTGFISSESYAEYYSGKENKTVKSYEYDLGGRLKKSTLGSNSTTYSYDILGNKLKELKSETKDGKTTTSILDYNYGDFDRLLSINKDSQEYIKYTYSELGNTLSQVEKLKDSTGKIIDVTTNYSYNLRNELSNVSVYDGKNTSITKNYYDIDGQRVRKVEDEFETNYMYVGSSILYTTDNNANKATENILDPSGGIVSTKRFDGKYENMYFKFTYDARGSIISILDPDINRVKGYGYDDAGNTTEVGDSAFKNEVKYGGMIEDEASGLHYMNARHYNPTSGRFLTEDTYNDPLSPDLYSYAGNNPVNYVDPTGHSAGGIILLLGTPVGQAILVTGLIIGIGIAASTAIANVIEKPRWKSTSSTGSISSPSIGNTTIRNYPSPWITHDSGIGDGTWGIPYGGVPGIPNLGVSNNYSTSAPLNTPSEGLINGIPVSQELSRVIENVDRIQEKANENSVYWTKESNNELEENSDLEKNKPKSERVGKSKGNTPRDNKSQNKQFKDVLRKLNINDKNRQRQLHDEISGQGYSYKEILEIAKDLFGL